MFVSYGFVALGAIGVASVYSLPSILLFIDEFVYFIRRTRANSGVKVSHAEGKSLSSSLKKLFILLMPIFVLVSAYIWLSLFGPSKESDFIKRRIMAEMLFAEAVEGSPCFVEGDRRLFLDGETWISASQTETEGRRDWGFSLRKCEIETEQEKSKKDQERRK